MVATQPMQEIVDFPTIDRLVAALAEQHYMADRGLATTLFLALRLGRPLLLEGEPGVGKTEVAKVLSQILHRPLVRLQCYEGLDIHQAVYEWNYPRQLLQIRLLEAAGEVDPQAAAKDLYHPDYLLRRPLLQAIDYGDGPPPVLLIDELDRADPEFEAFLLEVLADFQITIPELGTLTAQVPPVVVVTSNRTRELHDALKRRCLYHWIDYPSYAREVEIVRARVPHAPARLTQQVVALVQEVRHQELYKIPGVAETLDWVVALLALDCQELDGPTLQATLGVLLKYQDDIAQVEQMGLRSLLARALTVV